jgi:cytochrome c551
MMWKIRKIVVMALAATVLMSVTACQTKNNNGAQNENVTPSVSPSESPVDTTAPSPSDGVSTANAEAVYQSRCVACHAADLSGGAGPGLKDVGSRLSVEEITARIEKGGNGMAAFKGVLTDEEIRGLAEWLAAQKG